MYWIASALMMLLCANTAAAPQPQPYVLEGLRNAVDRGEIRAAVIGLYAEGESTVQALGRTGRDDARVPDGRTVLEIGSVSKVFTALLAQVQVEAGRLDWDRPISSYLPKISFASPAVAAITLRELATHTSGLPRVPANLSMDDALDPYAGYTRANLEEFLAGYQPETLDKQSAYSNLGAGLLGVIAADAAGTSYAAAMAGQVLEPLGMTDSAVGLPDRLRGRLASGFSQGADMPNWDGFDALAGAGAIVSTAADMLLFARRNLSADGGGGPIDGALAAIRQPQPGVNMGLGWQIDSAEGDPIYWHNGGTGGYASFLAIRPQAGTAVVLLTSSTAYDEVTRLGMAQITGKAPIRPSQSLQPYGGTYKLAEGFMLRVFDRDGQLFGQATGQGAFPLTADGEHRFAFPAAKIVITFDGADTGQATGLTMIQAGNTTRAPRVGDAEGPPVLEAIDLPAALLADYVGRYQLAPGIVIKIDARDGQMYAQLTGQTAYPVFAYENDAFFFKVVDAQLKFEREGQQVTAVVLHQGGQRRAPRID